jgi:O-antigen ligase
MIKKTTRTIIMILMAVMFLALPATNFPFFPSSMGGNSILVRPLSIFPLAVLAIILVVPRLFSKPIPRPVLIMLIFLIWGLVVSFVPLMQGVISPMKDVSLIPREIRTIITLAVGLLVFFSISLYPETKAALESSLKWLYGGLVLVLVWGSLQAIYILNLLPGWFDIMSKLQSFITSRSLNPGRAIGMTYEPTAFADQLIVIWLPWILAASINNYSVFKWRWKWITIERILSGWAMVILAFTLSKTGLILGIGLIVFGLLLTVVNPHKMEVKKTKTLLGSLIEKYRVLISLAGVLGFLFIFYILGSRVNYISRIWDLSVFKNGINIKEYLTYIGFGSRITYWETAWRIFLDHPIFGVGLGNYAIYFTDYLPFQKLILTPELLRRIVPAVTRSRVLSVKHFLIRILAEMGIVGFGLFLAFLIVLGAMGYYLWRSENKEERFWGTASLIGLVAFLGDTFSFDSFAIPNPWVLFGFITAAFSIFTKKSSNMREHE